MVYDFHTHTTLSDGELTPTEMIGRAAAHKYQAVALTDHSGVGTLQRIVEETLNECEAARNRWGLVAIPGVELTYVPPDAIAETAKRAKALGARLVVVHGETIVEPVPKGTNLAALQSPEVDILAHPGLMTLAEAKLAAANDKFVELSRRSGHCLANGHVARLHERTGIRLLVDSDAHDEHDLMSPSLASAVARGAGVSQDNLNGVLVRNPRLLLVRLGITGA